MIKYAPLALVSMLPVILSFIFYYVLTKTSLKNWEYSKQQILIGIGFGLVAIMGTEFGVPLDGLRVNARDAAPVCAGLIFGAPAGVIAGVIGGVERYFAAYWGAGFYTQIACTLGTIFAGLIAAWLRHYIFENKKPGPLYGLAIGAVAEIVHMTMIFITNINDARTGFHFIELCTVPMVTANSCSVAVALFVVAKFGKEKIIRHPEVPKIAETFQKWLLISILLAFTVAFAYTYVLQTRIYQRTTFEVFNKNLNDFKTNIYEKINADKLSEAEKFSLMEELAENRYVGNSGYILMFDRDRHIIPIGETAKINGNIVIDWENLKPHELVYGVVDDKKSYVMMTHVGDWYILAVSPKEQEDFSRNLSIYLMTFVIVIIFSILFVLIYCLIRHFIVDKIHIINDSLARITEGSLNEVINVRSNEEFVSLSDDINNTVETLKRYIKEAETRIDRELEFARQIQYSSLPSIFPPYPQHKEFDIFASMDTAKEVGGDFYDFYFVAQNKIAFIVADVSGKGIPAALFMMRAKAVIKALATTGASVGEICKKANNTLCQGNEHSMFVTAWLGILNIDTGEVSYVNAGHNPPFVLHSDGNGEWLSQKSGKVLGVMEDMDYFVLNYKFAPKDTIYIYTDGVTEGINESEELYGEERLENALKKCSEKSLKELCKYIASDLKTFAGDAEQFDDVTMLALRYNGAQ